MLLGKLATWTRRRKLRDLLLWAPRTMMAGLLLAALVAALARFRPLLTGEELAYLIAALGISGLLIGVIAALARPFSTLQQARFADAQFALQERAATAVELETGRVAAPTPLIGQQLADTIRAAMSVDTRAGLPLRLARRDWLVCIAALALLVAAVWLPNPQAEILRHQRAVAASVAEQVAALENLAQEIAQNPELDQGQREALLEPIESALEALQDEDLSQAQAVAVLSAAEADLRALGENTAAELLNNLQSAGAPLAGNSNAGALGEALQSGNLTGAGSAASQLADILPSLTPTEQATLAQDLAETAAALADIDPALAQQLADAAQALQNGDINAAQQALREAGGTLQARAQEAALAQQAAAAAGELQAGREQVAQAGQATLGQDQSQGAGQTTQGQGQGSEGDAGGSSGGEGGEGSSGDISGGTGGETGHSESVFVPDFTELEGISGEDVELPAECVTNPELCGGLLNENPTAFGDERSSVPYEQVFGDYRNAAYEALSDDYIPLSLKGLIRDYFSSLEPD